MPNSHSNIQNRLLAITTHLLKELKQERALRALSIDADLENALGIGSLEKAELFRRIEDEFDIQLEERLLSETETLRDLIAAITLAHPYIKPKNAEIYPQIRALDVNVEKAYTLIDVLERYVKQEPSRPHIYLQNEFGQEKIIDYGGLYEAAIAVAKGLINLDLQPKQTVAIMLPSSEEFFYAFFGVLIAGGIPVPIYPPFRASKLEEYMRREASILTNAETPILITFPEVEKLSKLLKTFVTPLKHVTTISKLLSYQYSKSISTKIKPDDAALIQYTSGSTGDPKGVVLTHHNLIENIKTLGQAIDVQPTDVFVSWLPLYHDMGLIGAWLGTLYHGVPVTIMSPLTFLTHPEKWLWAIHYHRGTLSAAPNFAYELCLSRISEKKLEGLDLSSWRMAFNGAEAVYPNTIRRFYEKFKKYGLSETAMCPVYGLAENTVGLCISDVYAKPIIDRIKRDKLDKEQHAVPVTDPDEPYHEIVNCGTPIANHDVRIVNDDNEELPDRHVGHLQFRGPCMMQGYYRRPEATAKITHDSWYDSGDFAYMVDGGVYITGREKDVIIKAGRNLYPQEVEEIVGDLDNVRKGCVVALGVRNSKKGTEQFIVIAETHAKEKFQIREIQSDIVETVATSMGLPPDEVVIVPPGTILKTSSGKLQRNATKQAYLEGKLVKRKIPANLQVIKMLGVSFSKKIYTFFTKCLKFLYTAYVLTFAALILIPFYPIIRWAPQSVVLRFIKFVCRLLLLIGFCPIRVNNAEIAKDKKRLIYIANHTSYMDSILLIAILPANVLFVGKKELLKLPIVGGYIQGCGYLTVDRLDLSESIKDVAKIQAALDDGKAIMIFPEGTFAYATGVRPFKLGAFNLAVQTQTPLCTIGLKGLRKLLRAHTNLLTPSKLTLNFGSIITPQGDDFQEAIRLRDESRKEISELCGERTINMVKAGPAVQPLSRKEKES